MSRSESEPIRPRERVKLRVASPPLWMKPATGDEAWVRAVVGLSGVLGDGARGQISRGTWEARRGGGRDRQRLGGIHNPESGTGRESDRPIVAGKRVMTVERRGLSREVLL